MKAFLSNSARASALDALARVEVARARLWAREVALLVELAGAEVSEQDRFGADEFLGLDLAGTCRYGQGTAAYRLHEADRLVHQLRQTLRWLGDGILTVHQAKEILKITTHATPAVSRELDRRLTAEWCSYAPADLRRKLGRLLVTVEAELDATAAAERRAAAVRTRAVWLRPLPDGMAEVGCRLSAERARQWAQDLEVLVRTARVHDRAAGVVRSSDQRRADVFAEMPAHLLATQTVGRRGSDGSALSPPTQRSGPGCGVRSRAVINIHVPVTSVLELDSRAGYLDGYGPLSAEHIRLLLPTASLRRVSVDADSGQPLQVDDLPVPTAGTPQQLREQLLGLLGPRLARDRAEPGHDPSAALGRLVDLRDAQCAGPGCARPAGGSDRDHHVPWPAGPTAAWNLTLLSRRCHRAKHAGWTLARHPDGGVTWTSPQGRRYSRPSPWEAPGPLPASARLVAPRPWLPPPAAGGEDESPEPDEALSLPAGMPGRAQAASPGTPDSGWPDAVFS